MLFMNIGRSSPRYEKLGLLYPQSKDLQSCLYEYYTVIVRLCHDLFKVTQKSVLIQAWHFLGESDVKTYESDLESLAKAMNEEVNLLMARGIEKQKSKLSSLSKHSEFSLHQHKQKLHFQVLESCSKYDHQQVWKQVRKSGTSVLLDQSPIYQEWKDRDISSTLVYKGKLGSGKSVLLANIVDDLNIHVQNRNIPVTYFFCRHDIDESLKTRTILGSLARQLLLGSIPDNVVSDFNGRPPSVLDDDEIVLLLQRALEPTFRAYFVLDGVDECDRDERKTLCHHLHRLQKIFALQVCFSFRIEADTDQELDLGTFVNCSVLTIPENNPDIDGYIYSELERRIESRQLALGNPTIALEIRDALQEGAHGMFLWVTLQIDSLCFAETDEAIRIALQNLPKDLPETFLRILQRSQKKTGSHHQKRILELCAIACRPLSTEELREALSVEPGNTNWDPSRLINDIYKVLSCCGSLIVVDEEDSTVRLVHHSLKQFMLGGFGKQADITSTEECANEVMADIITTYMNYGIFDNQVSTIVAPQIVAEALPSKIIRSAFDFSNIARSLAVRALQSRQQPDYNIGDLLLKESGRFNRYSAGQIHFIIYAKSHFLHHISYCSPMNSKALGLLIRLLEKDAVVIDTESKIDKLLENAIKNGYTSLTRILIEKGINIKVQYEGGMTPLHTPNSNKMRYDHPWIVAQNGLSGQ